ncbi:MAG TPA: M15 family metallopeptidase, partial [Flavobacteriales bacterium]|nr:M15 family metallopeptidase [Flavobacteriales bacterium]
MGKFSTFVNMKAQHYILLTLCIYSCANDSASKKEKDKTFKYETGNVKSANPPQTPVPKDSSELEKLLVANGLVNIETVVPGIHTDLRYSTTANFMKMDLYGDLERIYVQPEVAEKLKKAQSYLQQADSNLSLLIFDCVRPHSVQQAMWDTVKMPTW